MPFSAPIEGEWDGDDQVTFIDYPAKGWLGVCSYPYCVSDKGDQETPSAMVPGYSYSVYNNYFIMYLTEDCFTGDIGDSSDPNFDYGYAMSLIDADLTAWAETHFAWMF